MKIIRQKKDLKNFIKSKNTISFVPTMGGLHKGHEQLIKKAKNKKQTLIVSIFVNPKQFNSKKDFSSYPRNLKKDVKLLNKLKVDCLYYPNSKDIFNFKTKNKIYLHPFSKKLCGKFRPGHFEGVLNVVNRFLEIIKPKFLYLGKKDFQQLTLIKKHILNKQINTTIVPCETIKFKKFLPFSSRNIHLNNNEKNNAIKIFKRIKNEKFKIKNNKIKNISLYKLKHQIYDLGIKKIEYIDAINIKNLKNAKKYNENFNIFCAFYINKVRLIDNI